MSLATLHGHRVTMARADLPAWGAWYAEATIDEEIELSGKIDLVIADLTLTGTIVSGGPVNGVSTYRLVAGAAGWGKAAKAKSYGNDAGVRLATVLTDAAAEAGETLDAATVSTSATVGPSFVRDGGEDATYGRVLELVARENWYVAEDGTTRIGKRATVTYNGNAPRISPDPAAGKVTLAADEIAKLAPGIVVDGIEAVDVRHELGPGGLRSTVWGPGVGTTSRDVAAMRALVQQLLPDYRYRGVYEYRVVTLSGNRMNLQPVRVSLGMPDLPRVRAFPGVAGCKATVMLGSNVLVAFVNADPGRPVVVAFEDADGAGFVPPTVAINGSTNVDLAAASAYVIREGDSLTISGLTAGGDPVIGTAVMGSVITVPKSRVRA